MSWLSGVMHPGRAYDAAEQAQKGYYDQAQGFRQPFIDKGTGAGNSLQDMLSKLMNPGALQDEWAKGYEKSGYAQQLQDQSQTSGLDAASAMGLGGSSAGLANIQKGAGDIVQKDRQNYMNDMMQKYMGAMGLGESMYGTGANMASQSAQGAQQQGEWVGNNAFNKNQAGSNMLMKIAPMIMAMMMGKNPMGGDSGGFPGFGGMSSDMFGGS